MPRRLHTLWATLIHHYEDELLQKTSETLRLGSRVLLAYDCQLFGSLRPQADAVTL